MSETSLEELNHDHLKMLRRKITDGIVEDLQDIRVRLVDLYVRSGNEKYRKIANILRDATLELI